MPILDNQLSLQTKIEKVIQVKLENAIDEIARMQYALYQTEDSDTRFDKIYQKLTWLEASRQRDVISNKDQRKEIDTQLADVIFDMNQKIGLLDVYKTSYTSMGIEINEVNNQIKGFMDECKSKLSTHMKETNENILKMQDTLTNMERSVLQHKFDIDKLQSRTNISEELIKKSQKKITKLTQETYRLQEQKTDLKMYNKEMTDLTTELKEVKEISLEADASVKTMIDFQHKFEPIYIQRQITQALNYVFPDATIQWRLNWFNQVKMPMLTTLLLYESELDMEDNMNKFRDMIKLDSITMDELYVKNAMKSQTMHAKAVSIVQEAMFKLINSESSDAIRETSVDGFL